MTAASRGFGSRGGLREVGAADRLAELSIPVDVVLGELDSADISAASERIAAAARGPASTPSSAPGTPSTSINRMRSSSCCATSSTAERLGRPNRVHRGERS